MHSTAAVGVVDMATVFDRLAESAEWDVKLRSLESRFSQEAQQRVSTQKNATDLTGFGRGSESLTALKSAQSRIDGFIQAGKAATASLAAARGQ